MAIPNEGAEGTERRRDPLARPGGDSDAGDPQATATEAGGGAEEPGIGEEATAEPTADEAAVAVAVEEPAEPMNCAICNDPIDGAHLMASYGPVHDPGCSSQTKRVP